MSHLFQEQYLSVSSFGLTIFFSGGRLLKTNRTFFIKQSLSRHFSWEIVGKNWKLNFQREFLLGTVVTKPVYKLPYCRQKLNNLLGNFNLLLENWKGMFVSYYVESQCEEFLKLHFYDKNHPFPRIFTFLKTSKYSRATTDAISSLVSRFLHAKNTRSNLKDIRNSHLEVFWKISVLWISLIFTWDLRKILISLYQGVLF